MSFDPELVNQRLHPGSDLPDGVLMRWSEPNALYQRKRLGVFYYLWPFLGGDSTVELRADCIHQRIGGGGAGGSTGAASGLRSAYADIESCTVHRDSYHGTEFSVLRLKNRHKLVVIVEPVKSIIVPNNINLDSVLQILRTRGVQV